MKTPKNILLFLIISFLLMVACQQAEPPLPSENTYTESDQIATDTVSQEPDATADTAIFEPPYSDFTLSLNQTVYTTDIEKISLILTATEPGSALLYDNQCGIYRIENGEEVFVFLWGDEVPYETEVASVDEYATATVNIYLRYNGQDVISDLLPGQYRICMQVGMSEKSVDFELITPDSE